MLDADQKKIFAKNLNALIAASGKTQKEIANAIHVSPQTFNTWSKGIALPRMGKVQALADYFHIRKSDLIEEAGHSFAYTLTPEDFDRLSLKGVKRRSFPLVGSIACGVPIYASEEYVTFVEATADIDADFCLVAKGDSMVGARIFPGDIVFIKKCSIVDNGDIAVVIIDEEATLKRVYYYPEQQVIRLVSENPAYPPFVYAGEELDHVSILGKAVWFQSAVR